MSRVLDALAAETALGPDSVMLDVGGGLGRPLMHALVSHDIKRAVGIIDGRVNIPIYYTLVYTGLTGYIPVYTVCVFGHTGIVDLPLSEYPNPNPLKSPLWGGCLGVWVRVLG